MSTAPAIAALHESLPAEWSAVELHRAHAVEMLRLDLGEEEKAIADYQAIIASAWADEATKTLAQKHLADETAHAAWLRARIAGLA